MSKTSTVKQQSNFQNIIQRIIEIFPSACLLFFAVLCLALYAAPIYDLLGFSQSLYSLLGDKLQTEFFDVAVAMIVFTSVTFLVAILDFVNALQRRYLGLIGYILHLSFLTAHMVLTSVMLQKVKAQMMTAGGATISILVFSVIILIATALCGLMQLKVLPISLPLNKRSTPKAVAAFAVRYFPSLLMGMFSVLCFGFLATPVFSQLGFSVSFYEVLRDSSFSTHGAAICLILFSALAYCMSLICLKASFYEHLKTWGYLSNFAIYVAQIIASCFVIAKLRASQISVGAAPILILVFALLALCLLLVCCIIQLKISAEWRSSIKRFWQIYYSFIKNEFSLLAFTAFFVVTLLLYFAPIVIGKTVGSIYYFVGQSSWFSIVALIFSAIGAIGGVVEMFQLYEFCAPHRIIGYIFMAVYSICMSVAAGTTLVVSGSLSAFLLLLGLSVLAYGVLLFNIIYDILTRKKRLAES